MTTAATVAVAEPPIVLVPTPYTVKIDTREGLPYQFTRPLLGSRGKLQAVQTTVGTLKSGDYSLAGLESRVACERKSLSDLFGTIGGNRARFIRELERLNEMSFALIVIEATFAEIVASPPCRSKLSPRSVLASIEAWEQRFIRVHWRFAGSRELGEAATIRTLDRWWREWAARERVNGGNGNSGV